MEEHSTFARNLSAILSTGSSSAIAKGLARNVFMPTLRAHCLVSSSELADMPIMNNFERIVGSENGEGSAREGGGSTG